MAINHSINFLKFISIFAVIAMHTISINHMDYHFTIFVGLMRFCVPIFFLISGFYSYYTDYEIAQNKYKARGFRLFKLIIFANLFYIITSPIYNFINLTYILNIKSIIACLIFNQPLIAGHLWFLDALLYCYIFVFLLTKIKLNINKLYVLIPILLIIHLILGEVSNTIEIPINYFYYRNFIFTGLPFFLLGYFIHDKKEILKDKLLNNIIIILLLVSCGLISIESLYTTTDLYIGTILFSTIIFIWSVLNPNTLNFKLTEVIGGKLYGYIYILHLFFLFVLLKKFSIDFGYLNPILIFIITTVCSFLAYTLIRKIKYLTSVKHEL